jgi:electron transport complex protein RnfG
MAIIFTYKKNILITAALLMLFAVAGAALVGLAYIRTADDIKHNEELTLLRKLNTIIPAESYDNDLLADTTIIAPQPLLGTAEDTLVYRARKDNKNVAAIFSSIAPNGYNGPIQMLVGVYADGRLAGVRIVKHRETPGLGDAVELSHSKWILGFDNKSLEDPDAKHWKVKRDGGIFDQFTGATITPRAVVKAVHDALLYFEKNQATLFATRPAANKTPVQTKPAQTTPQQIEDNATKMTDQP